MIRFLSIRDLAVIDHLELELDAGLNILTGETGAGKSIVVGALALLRGGRASSDLVRTGADKAVVEAATETADGRERVLRREVSAHGRSRAFIDDRLVSTSSLRALGAELLDLHGQHEHQALLDPASHLDLLDRYADLGTLCDDVGSRFVTWRQAVADLNRVRMQTANREERADLVTFQLREIEDADPSEGEDDALAAQQKILANADRLHRLAAESYAELYDGDGAALGALDRVWKRVGELATLDPTFAVHLDTQDAIVSQLEELAYALRPYASGVDTSPERLQTVEDRLARLERLKRRYGPTLREVISRREQLCDEAAQLDRGTEREEDLRAQVVAARDAYLDVATTLSKQRRSQAAMLARTLERGLADLAMERTRFEVVFDAPASEEERWTDRGIDHAEFYFSANPGEDLKALARIASGGELSRVMLVLRTTVRSLDTSGKTLVFDEVDAGIGGEAAERIGAKLRTLADRYQVLCVTHLPQIAAYGTSHHRVTKSVRNGRTTTDVERLDADTRASEIARMMTGTRVSSSVLESARELLITASEETTKTARHSSPNTKGESERRK
ncbi:MAG: DNA repair protein RecN [Acidobacteria bacterium]|nr:DNA repair protein RecN [Acidobacteriota bacterium]